MKNLVLILGLAVSAVSYANEVSTSTAQVEATVAAVKPKWSATYGAYLYNFEGYKAANDNLYTFGDSVLQMQLFTVTYQASPEWTLMILGQHLDNYTETKMFGNIYKDRTISMGDTLVSGITPIAMNSQVLLLGDVGISIPTGSINLKNESNPKNNYAYNMQAGSGTYDVVAGLTTVSLNPNIPWGSHLTAMLRTGLNSNDYHLGNLYKLDAWAEYPVAFPVKPRLVGYYKHKDAISGYDKTLGRNVLTEFYHHPQINYDISAALKYAKQVGAVAVSVEAGVPVLQDSMNYDNAVVKTEFFGSVGVSGAF